MLDSAKPICFILTRDREKLKPFYSDILGLTQIGEDGFATSYDLGGITLRLTIVENHTPSPHTVLGWAVPNIAKAISALRCKGVKFSIYEGFGQDNDGIWTSPDGAAKVAWFNDPEGNGLSLTQSPG